MIYRLLENEDRIDAESLSQIDCEIETLWPVDDNGHKGWNYRQWFELYNYAHDRCGPEVASRLGGMMTLSSFAFGEEIITTSPNLRAILEFWFAKLGTIDAMHSFELEKVRGGLKVYVTYPLSGSIEAYFATGALSMINVVHHMATGSKMTTGIDLNFGDPHKIKGATQRELGVEIDSYCSKRDAVCAAAPSRKAQVEIFITNRLLDRNSPSWDARRHTAALKRFDDHKEPLHAVRQNTALPQLAESIQLTALVPMTVTQMAEKLGLSDSHYRRLMFEAGTSHKEMQKACVSYNVRSLLKRGCSRGEIVRITGIEARRLDRMLGSEIKHL